MIFFEKPVFWDLGCQGAKRARKININYQTRGHPRQDSWKSKQNLTWTLAVYISGNVVGNSSLAHLKNKK